MPQRAKPNDKDVINELLARQDGVIDELDKLEAEVLKVIESLNATRQEQLEEEGPLTADKSNIIKLPDSDRGADDDGEQSSRAA